VPDPEKPEKKESMKRLYLARHTKSSWEEEGVDDFDRPLLEKGIRKSQKTVKYLNSIQAKADKIVSSPAVRALETARLIAKGIGYPDGEIQQEHKLYEGSIHSYLKVIYSTNDSIESLMIFGHNPTITQVANLFLEQGVDFIPTMGMVCISFNTDKWSEIDVAERKNEFILFPKSLPG
jgi:phosphohistidine phosphatase